VTIKLLRGEIKAIKFRFYALVLFPNNYRIVEPQVTVHELQ